MLKVQDHFVEPAEKAAHQFRVIFDAIKGIGERMVSIPGRTFCPGKLLKLMINLIETGYMLIIIFDSPNHSKEKGVTPKNPRPATAGEDSTIKFYDAHVSRRSGCSQRQRSQAMMIALQMPPMRLSRFSRQSSIPRPSRKLEMLSVDSQPVQK